MSNLFVNTINLFTLTIPSTLTSETFTIQTDGFQGKYIATYLKIIDPTGEEISILSSGVAANKQAYLSLKLKPNIPYLIILGGNVPSYIQMATVYTSIR